jgi:hypothetical protein
MSLESQLASFDQPTGFLYYIATPSPPRYDTVEGYYEGVISALQAHREHEPSFLPPQFQEIASDEEFNLSIVEFAREQAQLAYDDEHSFYRVNELHNAPVFAEDSAEIAAIEARPNFICWL